jgi:hypothetical protein
MLFWDISDIEHQGYRKPGRKTKENNKNNKNTQKPTNKQKSTRRAAQSSKGQ